jgi:hypothetical protein
MACLSETVDAQSMILCSALTATEPVAGSSVSRRKWPTSAIVSVGLLEIHVWPARNKFCEFVNGRGRPALRASASEDLRTLHRTKI